MHQHGAPLIYIPLSFPAAVAVGFGSVRHCYQHSTSPTSPNIHRLAPEYCGRQVSRCTCYRLFIRPVQVPLTHSTMFHHHAPTLGFHHDHTSASWGRIIPSHHFSFYSLCFSSPKPVLALPRTLNAFFTFPPFYCILFSTTLRIPV
ncbi:hypothetical protein BD410DRAFT_429706 [Rickenella mellea]|uniref:Uncharacterized protein n=1 Tax=Rickenella mellea TaxID=50990 RepID=A0A4Y7QJS7_9AGAM|nr:hypothetical protein BD410DRAFT_429706 [Rickenella mellea]